jgi:hypothetical protein
MRLMSRVGFIGIALVAIVAALGGCGAGGRRASDGKRLPKSAAPRAPEKIVVAHRVGPKEFEPGEPTEELSASPCPNKGKNGTTTIPVGPDIGYCAQVAPSGRLGVLNANSTVVEIRVGDYGMRLRPWQTGIIPAPVRSYLGHGGHLVRAKGALGGKIWVLMPGCVLRPERLKPGEKLCFPEWLRRRGRVPGAWHRHTDETVELERR